MRRMRRPGFNDAAWRSVRVGVMSLDAGDTQT
jgi:hypothetical protein